MKTIKSTTVIALFAAVAMFAASCGGGNSNKQPATSETQIRQQATAGTIVQFVSLEQYSFDKERGMARFEIALDSPVLLMLEDVTTNIGEVSMVQCSSGDTKYWRVDIEGLSSTAPQEAIITIQKDKYSFEPKSRKVILE